METRIKTGLTRREFLANAGAAGAAIAIGFPVFGKEELSPTESNAEGPFYREGAPWRENFSEGLKGTPLSVSGKVLSTEGTPIEGAVVDLWHADGSAEYDNDSDKFFCRGRLKSGKDGAYAYETIVPGRYDLDGDGPGKAVRPAHIHYKISAKGFKPLTTQLYFKGDKALETDSLVRKSLTVDLKDGKAVFHGVLAPK